VRGGNGAADYPWTLSGRYLSGQIDAHTWRVTLKRWVTRDLQLGVEYSPLAGHEGRGRRHGEGHGGLGRREDPLRGHSAHKVMPMVNYRLVRERGERPALFAGTSMDRIGVPSGRAYYFMLSKDLAERTGVPASVFLSPTWSDFDDRVRLHAGASIRLGRGWAFLPTYDGHAFHPMLSYQWNRYTLTGILVRGRDPGVAFSIGF
jgi:hypothetical protein